MQPEDPYTGFRELRETQPVNLTPNGTWRLSRYADIRRLLQDYLAKQGYRAVAVPDGRGMWQAMEHARFDLIVLDLMLPGEDGLTLCRDLRARSNTPVVMVTALGEETDRIIGLEMGADDYLAKPFSPRELLARVKAVLP